MPPMAEYKPLTRGLGLLLRRDLWLGLLALAAGATAIVRTDLAMRREAFHSEARTAHRMLSQGTARLDAVLATLVLTARPEGHDTAADATAKLPALYPQVLAAWRREPLGAWPREATSGGAPVAALEAADAASRATPPSSRRAALASVDGPGARYTLVLAGAPSSFALLVDAKRLAPKEEWPWPEQLPIRATLTHQGQVMVLNDAGAAATRPFGLTDGFEFDKELSSASQGFVLRAQRFTGPAEWPWTWLAAWAAVCAAAIGVAARLRAARDESRRSAELERLARAGRLSTLGELAAGVAHELNQPLTATLSSTQTALRLLRKRPLDDEAGPIAIQALELAVAQARRAGDVVTRLRRLVQQGGATTAPARTDIAELARSVVGLLEPDLAHRSIEVRIEGHAPPALADATAVEQILHNLLANAMHALESHATARRLITIHLAGAGQRVRCTVRDNGPGIAPATAARLFEPFFTTRPGGLGLGLPLCQTLAMSMEGQVIFHPSAGEGAEFVLELPAADARGEVP